MCLFYVLLVDFVMFGSVSVLPVLGIRMIQSETSVILPGFCVCLCVCFYECVHVAVGLWGSLRSVLAVCVFAMFGSAPVWQVVGVYVHLVMSEV